MNVLMINSVCGIRSTGRICTDIAQALETDGHEVKIAYGRESVPAQYKKYAVRIGSEKEVKLHALQARLFDKAGFKSKRGTAQFIKWIKEYNPDVVHLHNLHGYYINIDMLFDYLKESEKKVIWTLHDCWAFTGHCVYCQMDKCNRWKIGCYECQAIHEYPKSFYDNSKKNWERKKKIFTGLKNMTIVTPSQWLSEKVKESFLGEYHVEVINNGIDINVFQPTTSDIKERYGILDKKVLLGVAAVWDARKGLSDFIELSETIPDNYVIVLIGLNEKQMVGLPDNILGIKRTNDIKELAAWYSVAEMFINPTYEDNYPTTNLEAIACGTPVITYHTGGAPESAMLYGKTISHVRDMDLQTILCDCKHKVDICTFSRQAMAEKYVNLYR